MPSADDKAVGGEQRRLLYAEVPFLHGWEVPQHQSMNRDKCGFAYCRWLLTGAMGALLLFSMAVHVLAESRLNLPQVAAEVRLNAEAKLELDSMLEKWTSDPTQAIAPDAWRLLLESLPAELRNGLQRDAVGF